VEWLVPVLFVVVSLAQWWLKRQKQSTEPVLTPAAPQESKIDPEREADPFGEFGDLLEALGRRRHESPPSPSAIPPRAAPPAKPFIEFSPPIIAHKDSPPRPHISVLPQVLTDSFSGESATPLPVFVHDKPTFSYAQPHGARRHSFQKRLSDSASLRQAIILSEILAPPLALR
jgi:hypothetical protein